MICPNRKSALAADTSSASALAEEDGNRSTEPSTSAIGTTAPWPSSWTSLSGDEILREERLLHELGSQAPPNVARIYTPFKGDDGRVYLPEELLYRPLEALSPLRNGEQFLRVAKDLFLGLSALHELRLVHRDLKLDNCGVDFSGRAKIFDLGALTSEGAEVKGTVLTRAPELFRPNPRCKPETDVWGLGATLFALRCEHYPFVKKSEVEARPADGQKREEFERLIQSRALEPGAEEDLRERIGRVFPTDPGQMMTKILAFDPAARPTAKQAHEDWDRLLRSWVQPGKPEIVSPQGLAREFAAYLKAVFTREVGMTAVQWERTAQAIEDLREKVDNAQFAELTDLGERIRELRQSGELR